MSEKLNYHIILNTITLKQVDNVAEELTDSLSRAGVESHAVTSVRILIESVLLDIKEAYGEFTHVEIKSKRFLGRKASIKIYVEGKKWESSHDDRDAFFSGLIANSGVGGIHLQRKYTNGVNIFTIPLPSKGINPIIKNLMAIGMAFAIWGIISNFPPYVAQAIREGFVEPTFSAIVGLLTGTAALMIFLSVVQSVAGMGSLSVLNRYGKTTIKHYFMVVAIMMILGLGVMIPIIGGLEGFGEANSSGIAAIYQMILDIIPSNIVDPFLNSNTLQITFIGACVGGIMLAINSSSGRFLEVVEDLSSIFMRAISIICSKSWALVFLSMFKMLLAGMISELASAYKIVLMGMALMVLQILSCILRAVIVFKKKAFGYLRQAASIGILGLSTASSFACMDRLYQFCDRNGVERERLDFIFPMTQIFFKSDIIISIMSYYLIFSGSYNVPITGMNLIVFIILLILINIATPPVPGGGLLSYSIAFSTMGFPSEALSLAIAIDPIMDMCSTGTKMLTMPMEILTINKKISKNEDKRMA